MTSAFAKPLLIGPSGPAVILERVPLTAGGVGQMSERWLQEALFASPESLPVTEIDPHIGPLIPVCMEIETGSGPADILFVTPTGQVVLVETKLWRNPEARREVVGQILDYAKQLSTWTFEILDQKAATAAKAAKNHLISCLKARFPDADETAFVDGVGRSLATGDFLLLIVGDGIQRGAESLVAFLEKYGHLRFGFGLIEVAAYALPGGTTLLQPRILAKTEVVQRTLFMGPNGPITFQQAAQAEEASATNSALREWFAAFWGQFLSKLRLDDAALMPTDPAKSTNQFFPMPPRASVSWISAYIAQSSGKAGVYLTLSKVMERGSEVFDLLEGDREAIEREVGTKLTWERSGGKFSIIAPNVTFADLNVASDRDRVISYLVQMTEHMIQTLRPRMQAIARDLGL